MLKNYSVFCGFTLIGRVAAEDEVAAFYLATVVYASCGKFIRVECEK